MRLPDLDVSGHWTSLSVPPTHDLVFVRDFQYIYIARQRQIVEFPFIAKLVSAGFDQSPFVCCSGFNSELQSLRDIPSPRKSHCLRS